MTDTHISEEARIAKVFIDFKNDFIDHWEDAYRNPKLRKHTKQFLIDRTKRGIAEMQEIAQTHDKAVELDAKIEEAKAISEQQWFGAVSLVMGGSSPEFDAHLSELQAARKALEA